jgi:hypothetical protein
MIICCIAIAQAAHSAGLTRDATRLAQLLDQTRSRNSTAGVHIVWETGLPDGKPEKSAGKRTHCSASSRRRQRSSASYSASAGHGQILLANAQYDWLSEQAARGLTEIQGAEQAQESANRGYLVAPRITIITTTSPAISHRAAERQSKAEMSRRPQTPGRGTNYLSTTLRRGFAHPGMGTSRSAPLRAPDRLDSRAKVIVMSVKLMQQTCPWSCWNHPDVWQLLIE